MEWNSPLTPIVTKISFSPFCARRGPPTPKRGEDTFGTRVRPLAKFGVNWLAGCREIVDKKTNKTAKVKQIPRPSLYERMAGNNKHDNVYGAVINAEPLQSSPGSFDECRMAPSGRRPKTKPDDLGCESACTGCQKLHPPSPFIITQPESWYSFYCPTEGRRQSRPSWLVTYRDGLPVHRWSPIRVLTWSDVAQLRWSKPTCYH